MRNQTVLRISARFVFIALAGVPLAATAQDVQLSAVSSLGGSVETNPYNELTSSGASVAATFQISPHFSARDERTSVDFDAMAKFRQFLRRYGLEDNYALNASIVHRLSENLTVRGSSGFAYDQGGFNGFGRPNLAVTTSIASGLDPLSPKPAVDPLIATSDVTILGQRTRTKSYSAALGADWASGPYSSFSLGLDARALRFQTAGLDSYNSYHAEGRWKYELSERFSAGLIGGYGKTNYLNIGQGDASTADLLATVDARLSGRWTVSVSAGGSFTRIDGREGRPDSRFSSISTRLNVCRLGGLSQFCLGAQRSPQPTASGSVRISSTVTADYSTRLSEHQNLALSVSYAKTGSSHDLLTSTLPGISFVSASAQFNNQFSSKMTGFVSTNISKSYSQFNSPKPNIGLTVGLQYAFGRN